jgi:hypothetical protein
MIVIKRGVNFRNFAKHGSRQILGWFGQVGQKYEVSFLIFFSAQTQHLL